MFHHALVVVLLSRSWRVRKQAQLSVKKLLSTLGGSSLAHSLLGELRSVINAHKVRGGVGSDGHVMRNILHGPI